jgi:hypothetical protein
MSDETIPDEAVAAIADEMRNCSVPRPFTEEERAWRQIEVELWRHECQQRDQEQRRLAEQRRAAQEREAAGQVRREAELAARAAKAKNRREFFQRQQEREQRRDITALRSRVAQQASWQRDVEQAARNAVSQQRRQALIADLERSFNPPPQPEPEVHYIEPYEGSNRLGDSDFNVSLMSQPMRWW